MRYFLQDLALFQKKIVTLQPIRLRNDNMIKFTIITCTYNAAKVLKRTMESVHEQVYPYYEHIIMDGRSTDGTLLVAGQYSREDLRVIVKSEKDNGLYDAMNKAIQIATGDYILFLNAGDTLFCETTLEDIAGKMRYGNKPAVLYGDTDIVDNWGLFLHPRRLRPPKKLTWRSFKFGMLVCHQAFYVRKDLAKNTPYDTKYKYSADVDWCIRIMKAAEAEKATILNTRLTVCSYLDGGMTTQHHRESLKERFWIMVKHYGLITTLLMHLWFCVRKK